MVKKIILCGEKTIMSLCINQSQSNVSQIANGYDYLFQIKLGTALGFVLVCFQEFEKTNISKTLSI